jgi:hypothetical protein
LQRLQQAISCGCALIDPRSLRAARAGARLVMSCLALAAETRKDGNEL